MRKVPRVSLPILVVLCVVGTVWTVAAADAKAPVVWPSGDIKWSDNPAVKGAKIAVLWGDPKTGAYGALKKLPGWERLPLHTHSHDQRVVTLSGSIVLSIEGSPAKELAAGSFAFIPGGAKHTADCKAGAECTYFEEQPGASDLKFVEKK